MVIFLLVNDFSKTTSRVIKHENQYCLCYGIKMTVAYLLSFVLVKPVATLDIGLHVRVWTQPYLISLGSYILAMELHLC